MIKVSLFLGAIYGLMAFGEVAAVWFRCLRLPFQVSKVDAVRVELLNQFNFPGRQPIKVTAVKYEL